MRSFQVIIVSGLLSLSKTSKHGYRMGVGGMCLAHFRSAGRDAIHEVPPLTRRFLKTEFHYMTYFPTSVQSLTYLFPWFTSNSLISKQAEERLRCCSANAWITVLHLVGTGGRTHLSLCLWDPTTVAGSPRYERTEAVTWQEKWTDQKKHWFSSAACAVNVSDFVQRLPQQPEHVSLSLCIYTHIYICKYVCVGVCIGNSLPKTPFLSVKGSVWIRRRFFQG